MDGTVRGEVRWDTLRNSGSEWMVKSEEVGEVKG